MNEQQKDAVYTAYLGIQVLHSVCKTAGLVLGAEAATATLTILSNAFPGLKEEVEAQQQRVEGRHEA
jgi:hypothetical protein